MSALVIYDSLYGNTEKIARIVSNTLNAKLEFISKAKVSELSSKDLVILGSPVHGGRPTVLMEQFIKSIPPKSLQGVKVAAFDTRFSPQEHGFGLKMVMSIIRFAAEKMVKSLVKKGGTLISAPQGFIVKDKTGPLAPEEELRAREWAQSIKEDMAYTMDSRKS